MGFSDSFVTESAFNRLTNLDNVEWHIIDYLLKSDTKYAQYLWKLLAYDTQDCLSKPNVPYAERIKLVYTGNGESTSYRVFMTPYIDDAWEEQTAHLHIYLHSLVPRDHLHTVVNIGIETVVHNKISNIFGDASRFNDFTNPVELQDGRILTPYKSRASEMVKNVIGELNGTFVNGIGVLQFNQRIAPEDGAKLNVWNGKKFFGHQVILSSMLSGVSEESGIGY